jgi:hypothetical protein
MRDRPKLSTPDFVFLITNIAIALGLWVLIFVILALALGWLK